MGVPNHLSILQNFFNANAHRFNFNEADECGKFTEEFLVHLLDETNDYHYSHLRKYGSSTQYNGHAIDVILYDNRSHDDGTDFMEVDILASAESSNCSPSWQVRETPYTESDVMNPDELPNSGSGDEKPPEQGMTFPPYEMLGGDQACAELIGAPMEIDYAMAKQAMNAGSSVWVNRTVYDALFWVVTKGMPPRMAYEKSCEKRRPEWRAALGLDPVTGQPKA